MELNFQTKVIKYYQTNFIKMDLFIRLEELFHLFTLLKVFIFLFQLILNNLLYVLVISDKIDLLIATVRIKIFLLLINFLPHY
jgi:hypothetical protein